MHIFFNRKWWWTTLIVIAAVGVMIRLGLWQLDRHYVRQNFNARATFQLNQPLFLLNAETLHGVAADMEYRPVTVDGEYDFTQQVALRNQQWQGRLGVYLLTPLVIAGTDRAVLINRGWVAADEKNWRKFDEAGKVEIRGTIRAAQTQPDFGGIPDPEGQLQFWNLINVERISAQISRPMLNTIYIQQTPPNGDQTSLPYRAKLNLDLSEGSHLGYAAQWFLFATVLAVGYPFFVRDTERKRGD